MNEIALSLKELLSKKVEIVDTLKQNQKNIINSNKNSANKTLIQELLEEQIKLRHNLILIKNAIQSTNTTYGVDLKIYELTELTQELLMYSKLSTNVKKEVLTDEIISEKIKDLKSKILSMQQELETFNTETFVSINLL